ncbi:MAG: hydrogenase expression/formation protein HypE [Verrucomicrobia bacterium]|nr:hydrogenase expression/formation protein HypE [Verrucomicrobiota bacterium]
MPSQTPLDCPLPFADYPNILLAHGGGGRLTRHLIEELFLPAFRNPPLDQLHDGAELAVGESRLAFTTDSYVVRPLFFPGGDIGTLAVNGTVNDLAMCGARPKWLSAAFIVEEGLPLATLERVVQSMRQAATVAGVQLVTGDTKVVDKGKADGLFLNTAGIGVIERPLAVNPAQVRPGDGILLNGDLGRHGMAVMAARESLGFDPPIQSDCAPLAAPVLALLDAGIEVHCLRDLTRGGLASALNEIASTGRVRIAVDECAIPVNDEVRGACEILGLDPLYVANEGRFVAFVAPGDLTHALQILHSQPLGREACLIGAVTDAAEPLVTMKSRIGVERVLDLLSGEQLPRIC